jgi:hypothetical protein
MKMTTVPTFTATIYVGTKIRRTGVVLPLRLAQDFLHLYCDMEGLCVTLTPTEFIYTRTQDSASTAGGEPGFIIGLINYPRFPASPESIRAVALEIAENMRFLYEQYAVTVVFLDETVMLGGV